LCDRMHKCAWSPGTTVILPTLATPDDVLAARPVSATPGAFVAVFQGLLPVRYVKGMDDERFVIDDGRGVAVKEFLDKSAPAWRMGCASGRQVRHNLESAFRKQRGHLLHVLYNVLRKSRPAQRSVRGLVHVRVWMAIGTFGGVDMVDADDMVDVLVGSPLGPGAGADPDADSDLDAASESGSEFELGAEDSDG